MTLWNDECDRRIKEGRKKQNLYLHYSPALDSLGYPPDYCVHWSQKQSTQSVVIGILRTALETLMCCVTLTILYILTRGLRDITNSQLAKSQWLQIIYDLKPERRKNVGTVCGVLTNELNPSFFSLEGARRIRQSHDSEVIVSCLALLTLREFIQVFKVGWSVAAIDWRRRTGPRAVTRAVINLLKAEAIATALDRHNNLRLMLYWENRGYENHLASRFPNRTVLIVIGVEGEYGPTYINHPRQKFECHAFVNSRWEKHLLGHRFAEGMLIPRTLEKFSLDLPTPRRDSTLGAVVNQAACRSPRVVYVQTTDDFGRAESLAKQADELDFRVLYHPEYRGDKSAAVNLVDVLSADDPSDLVFVFSSVSTLPYQLLQARYVVLHDESGGKCNFISGFGVRSVASVGALNLRLQSDVHFVRNEQLRLDQYATSIPYSNRLCSLPEVHLVRTFEELFDRTEGLS